MFPLLARMRGGLYYNTYIVSMRRKRGGEREGGGEEGEREGGRWGEEGEREGGEREGEREGERRERVLKLIIAKS